MPFVLVYSCSSWQLITVFYSAALQEVFSYVNADGSMREFRGAVPSAVWVTAYTLETLADIHKKSAGLENQFQIPTESLEKMALWLSQQQDKHGRYVEVGVEHVSRLKVCRYIINQILT